MIAKIKPNVNDIFRYVVENTLRDPIEVQISFDDRYEMFDECIFDAQTKELIPQNESYQKFAKALTKLKMTHTFFDAESLLEQCAELAKHEVEVTLE